MHAADVLPRGVMWGHPCAHPGRGNKAQPAPQQKYYNSRDVCDQPWMLRTDGRPGLQIQVVEARLLHAHQLPHIELVRYGRLSAER